MSSSLKKSTKSKTNMCVDVTVESEGRAWFLDVVSLFLAIVGGLIVLVQIPTTPKPRVVTMEVGSDDRVTTLKEMVHVEAACGGAVEEGGRAGGGGKDDEGDGIGVEDERRDRKRTKRKRKKN